MLDTFQLYCEMHDYLYSMCKRLVSLSNPAQTQLVISAQYFVTVTLHLSIAKKTEDATSNLNNNNRIKSVVARQRSLLRDYNLVKSVIATVCRAKSMASGVEKRCGADKSR